MPHRPRVDILNINFFDWDGQRAFTGGAERYVLDLARLLAGFGMRPRLLQNAHFAFERHVDEFEVVGVPATRKFDLAAMSAGFAAPTRDAALVIASPVELASRLGSGPPVIGINHGIWWDLPGFLATYPELADHEPLYAALRSLSACVAVDTNFINWLRASGQSPPRVHYIPNYVDHSRFHAREKDFDTPLLTVLFPRRLCHERGFHDAMRAFETLWAEGAPCHLHLCGGGVPAEEELARAFADAHPERARWSAVPAEDMPEIYAASQVVIIPTVFSEGTSLACLEAMATNNGIVATHVGGLPNLILHEVNGLLIEPGADALAAAVRRLLHDRRLLAALALRARQVAATFTAQRWQRRWAELLQTVLPVLAPAVERWLAALVPQAVPGAAPGRAHAPVGNELPTNHEAEIASARGALADLQVRVQSASSERDGAYRAALVAAFDRDAAFAERDRALAAGALERDAAFAERDRALAAGRAAAFDRDAAFAERDGAVAAGHAALERLRAKLSAAERQHSLLAGSRGVRLMRALDRRGRYLLPPAVEAARLDERSTVTVHAPAETAVDATLRVSAGVSSGQVAPEESIAPQASGADGEAASRLDAGMRPGCCGLVSGLVSVVLPVYNQAELVGSAIRSVLAQTYSQLELIVVDDGSTDSLQTVLAEFAEDPRVRVVVQDNQRLPQALSNGFAQARGEYWTWTSADNLMAADQLERMVARLRSEAGLGMVYADYWVIDDRGNPLADGKWRGHNRPDPLSHAVHLPRTTERLNAIADNFIGPCFLYRGWIGRVLGAYDPHQGVEDYDYWMRINALFSIKHLGSSDPLYWYRVHDNTLSARADAENIPQKIERLMAFERERTHWYRRALTVHLDSALGDWWAAHELAGVRRELEDPATVAATMSGPTVAIVPLQNAAAFVPVASAGDTLPLVIVVPAGAAVPEEAAAVLRRPRVLIVVEEPADAQRLRTWTTAALIDGRSSLLDQAIGGFARNASYASRAAR